MKTLLDNKFIRTTTMIFIFVCLALVLGCGYYVVKPMNPLTDTGLMAEIQKKDKYIIVHQDGLAFHVKNVVILDSTYTIHGTLLPLPITHLYYQTAKKPRRANRFSHVPREDNPTFEVHLYTTALTLNPGQRISIPFASINKVDVYDRHVGATVVTVVGISLSVFVLVAVIVAATKSSCPLVYAGKDSTYQFAGEIFGGAIYPALERDDYLPLPGITSVGGQHQIKITNELLERQYTNLATLVAVDHPDQSTILLDKYGKIQTLQSPVSPLAAISNAGHDYSGSLLARDSNAYFFDDALMSSGLNDLTLSFDNCEHATTGKLVLRAKNSLWLDYLYGKLNEQFGTYYNTFAAKQKRETADKLNQWSEDQNIPLSVYVETNRGWKLADTFPCVGPLASRDIVIALDLSDAPSKTIRVKLTSGFMFWEIDYAAMDFTTTLALKATEILPVSAVDETGCSVTAQLVATDNEYLIQPAIGNETTIVYTATPAREGWQQTCFLHSRGYYEYIRDYKNSPDIPAIMSFKRPGAFPMFSRDLFMKFQSEKGKDILSLALNQQLQN